MKNMSRNVIVKESKQRGNNRMRLTVNDIKKLWENGQAKLVAGEKGLDRTVVVYDMMEQPDIKPWLRKDMLLITTGYAIRNNKEAVLNLIRDLNEVGAAALAIKTRFFDQFPEEALKLADELHFPLFFLNNALGFIEAVYPVMVAIVEAKNGVEMRTRYQIGQIEKKELDRKFYFDLIQERFEREEEAQIRANSLYWPMMPARMLEICSRHPGPEWFGQKKEKAEQMAEAFFMQQNLAYIIISLPEKTVMLFRQPDRISTLKKALEQQVENLEKTVKTDLYVAISDRIDSYLDMPKVSRQVSDLCRIAGIDSVEDKVLWWEEMKYEELLLEISKLPMVKSYIKERLYNLEEYDRKHGTNLMETLEVMLRNGGSKKQTAEKLYLHRNTMIYRAKKIEEILQCNIGDFKTLQELSFVCRVREYLTENEGEHE